MLVSLHPRRRLGTERPSAASPGAAAPKQKRWVCRVRRCRLGLLEPEYESERVLDGQKLAEADVRNLIAEVARVNRANHFAEHACALTVKIDLRMKARGRRAC